MKSELLLSTKFTDPSDACVSLAFFALTDLGRSPQHKAGLVSHQSAAIPNAYPSVVTRHLFVCCVATTGDSAGSSSSSSCSNTLAAVQQQAQQGAAAAAAVYSNSWRDLF
jgi:hypothetical protein